MGNWGDGSRIREGGIMKLYENLGMVSERSIMISLFSCFYPQC